MTSRAALGVVFPRESASSMLGRCARVACPGREVDPLQDVSCFSRQSFRRRNGGFSGRPVFSVQSERVDAGCRKGLDLLFGPIRQASFATTGGVFSLGLVRRASVRPVYQGG